MIWPHPLNHFFFFVFFFLVVLPLIKMILSKNNFEGDLALFIVKELVLLCYVEALFLGGYS